MFEILCQGGQIESCDNGPTSLRHSPAPAMPPAARNLSAVCPSSQLWCSSSSSYSSKCSSCGSTDEWSCACDELSEETDFVILNNGGLSSALRETSPGKGRNEQNHSPQLQGHNYTFHGDPSCSSAIVAHELLDLVESIYFGR